MRTLFMAAVAAAAALTLAAGAFADPNDSEATLNVSASPAKAGTKKKPRAMKLTFDLTVSKPGTTVQTIETLLPKGVRLSGKGFKRCDPADVLANGPTGCPKASRVGPQGTTDALLGTAPLHFDVSSFVGDDDTLLFYLDATTIDLQTVVKGELTNHGRKMSIAVPFELRQPVPGVDSTLTGLTQVFSARSGKHSIVSSTGCPKGGWTFGGRLVFASRADGAPVPGPEARKTTQRCKRG